MSVYIYLGQIVLKKSGNTGLIKVIEFWYIVSSYGLKWRNGMGKWKGYTPKTFFQPGTKATLCIQVRASLPSVNMWRLKSYPVPDFKQTVLKWNESTNDEFRISANSSNLRNSSMLIITSKDTKLRFLVMSQTSKWREMQL